MMAGAVLAIIRSHRTSPHPKRCSIGMVRAKAPMFDRHESRLQAQLAIEFTSFYLGAVHPRVAWETFDHR